MKAVILCGGKGTRIREVTDLLPKPMVPIGDKPILWHIMKIYSYYGINDFILCLGYRGWDIKQYFLNYSTINNDFTLNLGTKDIKDHHSTDEANWNITFAETGMETQTGGRLWKIRKYLEGEKEFCFTYGDGLANVDVNKLIENHRSTERVGTITGVRPAGRFGELGVDGGVITHFNEKPQSSEGWINGGFMVFNTEKIWNYFWPDEQLILEKEPLPAMVKDKQLAVYKHDGFWVGMDTMREYSRLTEIWNSGKAPWKIWS